MLWTLAGTRRSIRATRLRKSRATRASPCSSHSLSTIASATDSESDKGGPPGMDAETDSATKPNWALTLIWPAYPRSR